MRAVVTRESSRGSIEMIDLAAPQPRSNEVLIELREVGVDGTDYEVLKGEHGQWPSGDDYLILGHEALGRVAGRGPSVRELDDGDWVVSTVRRPDQCPNCRRGESDMCLWGDYTERGIKGAHGFLAEYIVERPEFVVPVAAATRPTASLVEPLSIVEKALEQVWSIQRRMYWEPRVAAVFGLGTIGLLTTMLLRLRGLDVYTYSRDTLGSPEARLALAVGAHYISQEQLPDIASLGATVGRIDLMVEATGSPEIVAAALPLLLPNAVLCLLSITGERTEMSVDIAAINQRLVLGNGVVFGSVNSNRRHFEQALSDLIALEERFPGCAAQLITRRVPLERFREAFTEQPGDIKVLVDFAGA
ncbi:MAG: glucose 1-dehydrogenase [Gemmatimonadaceae bacterium]